ncbi:MAG: methyl-accepting chemotaxis protein [Nitrospirae bacterium]|nr:MAG: methyl-accepting chemotaxis protein [Nitrospirota bacterium]
MGLKGMKIGKRLGLGFGVVIFLVFVVGAIGHWGLHSVSSAAGGIIKKDVEMLEHADDIKSSLLNLRRYEKDLFINIASKEKQDGYLKKWKKEYEEFAAQVKALEKVVSEPKDKEAVQLFQKQIEVYGSGFNKVLGLINDGKVKTTQEANAAIGEFKDSTHKLEKEAEELAARAVKKMDSSAEFIQGLEKRIVLTMAVLVGVAACMGLVFGVFIVKSILNQLGGEPAEVVRIAEAVANGDLTMKIDTKAQDETSALASVKRMVKNLRKTIETMSATSNNVAGSSEELSATVQQMSGRVSEQSTRATQIAAATTEMSHTVIDIARNASEIASSANNTLKVAEEGSKVVNNTVNEVQAISNTVTESAQLITSLGERSKQIGDVVTVIKDIADQTNLLALNAAIEAARAGEQGRGFAVVADEVRKLAERTAKATTEIGDMINSIQGETDKAVSAMEESLKRVESGVAYSNKAGDGLQRIVSSVHTLQGMVEQIAAATNEMSTVSDGIGSDLETVSTVSQETTDSANGIAQASNDLARLAVQLKEEVSKFKL